MPPKIKELIGRLEKAGFEYKPGKGSHRKFLHPDYPFVVSLSGKSGEDAKLYQERLVKKAIEDVKK
ncbi:MAG: type II toxin-antitoxin system HicA family toxin [Deltaproteobacteria bacterium]|nr:type II toxin-antitoxin system HicA family toxin [Deltaproteobacteria bacterium]